LQFAPGFRQRELSRRAKQRAVFYFYTFAIRTLYFAAQ